MKKEVRIGIFTLLMIAGAWGGIRFLSGVDMFNSNHDIYASYNDVSGIQNASPVFIHGVKVGSVTDIELDKESCNVTLRLNISGKYNIPSDSKAEIFSNGLMGGKAINIIMGSNSSYLTTDDTIETGYQHDMFERAESEIADLKQMVDGVTSELEQTLATLNKIMVNNAEHIGAVAANMDALTANLSALVDSENGDISRIVSGFADVSQTLGNNAMNIDSIVLNINTITSQMASAELSSSLKNTLDNLATMTSQLSAEGGTLGKMMNDEELYDNLASASANLDSLLFDMKDRPDRYINVSVFGKDYDKKYAKAEKKRAKAEKKNR